MPYTTVDRVKTLLPPNVLQRINQPQSGITDAIIQSLIIEADSEINTQLSAIYAIPLKRVKLVDPETGTTISTEYPPSIIYISSRITCSLIYNKLFASEQGTNISQYGLEFRKTAQADLDSIKTHNIKLIGQRPIGERFVRDELFGVNSQSFVKDINYPSKETV